MAENSSWLGNQPQEAITVEARSHGAVSMLWKPFLKKGSGSVQRRLVATRERKYVPKGGFISEECLPSSEVLDCEILS